MRTLLNFIRERRARRRLAHGIDSALAERKRLRLAGWYRRRVA